MLKPISQLVRPLESQPQSPLGNARADRLWARLGEIYGSSLVQSFGETPPRTWVDLVASLSDEQMVRALRDCAMDTSRFPPSTGQFRAWAIVGTQNTYVPQLEKPKDRDLAKMALTALKRIVRGLA